MAINKRRNARRQTSKRGKARRTSNRLHLSGPGVTWRGSVSVIQTSTFDLSNDLRNIGISPDVYPISMKIYAIPPRDTDITSTARSAVLPKVNYAWTAVTAQGASAEVQAGGSILQFNRGPVLVASADFRKWFSAGLEFPIKHFGISGDFPSPCTIGMDTDGLDAWNGPDISIYVVLTFEDTLTFGPAMVHMLDGSSTSDSAADMSVVDNDVRASQILSNNTAGALRRTAAKANVKHAVVAAKSLRQTDPKQQQPLSNQAIIAGAAQAHHTDE